MKASLDLHDWSVVHNGLDLLLRLKEIYPTLKVSLFAVPIDERHDFGQSLIRSAMLEKIKKNLDWLQFIPHGLYHNGSEMKHMDYHHFKDNVIPSIEKAFNHDGLPFEKGFCAPHWRWSSGVVKALNELGWWGAVDRRQPNMLSTKRFYRYSHCIDEELVGETLKMHGHVYGTSNDLERCLDNIKHLPPDIEWYFITDFLEDLK